MPATALQQWRHSRVAPVMLHLCSVHHKLGVATCAQLIQRIVNEFLALTASPGSILLPVCPALPTPTGRCGATRGLSKIEIKAA
jgi:hypothetical protein